MSEADFVGAPGPDPGDRRALEEYLRAEAERLMREEAPAALERSRADFEARNPPRSNVPPPGAGDAGRA